MRIYRIEHGTTTDGMWYDHTGNYAPFIMTLTQGKSKYMSMEFDERYRQGGLKWLSGCFSKDLLKQWFSEQDARELLASGYKLYEIEARQYIVEEHQVLFTREGVVSQREIPLEQVWEIGMQAPCGDTCGVECASTMQ